MRANNPGSGSLATDHYRDSKGREAANVLKQGRGSLCKSADHLNGTETCTEVIVRHANNVARMCPNASENTVLLAAADNLERGLGQHKNQASHSGNTCAQVIAAATS